ncbi:molecular chaperone HtpG [Tsukamurella sp. 8F]|uniref:molecular chaperone HtpG n=1 Tax=unclassified Tsukamurella TaxID=2633480 RepID=UPI0023BA0C0F|nr:MULTISPECIES: molecular chaperone HtpG [unclassified Tsukamurella]MDF0531191.1 molecular chaperone HtpG [Tsukamurella sp. 8J]MDF0585862.1 molecular chaperone HtpG [Tsukamurella sp. 8F]
MAAETLQFQAETHQLLDLMIHSVYSEKDIFLRELISNASDALDKLRLAAYQDKDLSADTADLHIELKPDAEARTLTIADNGIGMSREDVVELIGTLAKSGTGELRRKLAEAAEARDSGASAELIGQFGIGFYSSFMVADKVTLETRRAGEEVATRWESSGESTYTVTDLAAGEGPAQGTVITLHLKAEDADDSLHDYTSADVLRRIVRRYSDFIAFPIRIGDDVLNSMKALWTRPRSEVTDEEYTEFYRHVSHAFDEPLETIDVKAEGTFEYQALLFIPSQPPFDMFYRGYKTGLQLYVKRVFIMDDCEALIPPYLRFVKGVVDAQDLSLNVSREILQQDRQLTMIRKRLVKKVISTVKALREKDRAKYEAFWAGFGSVFKEGLLDDHDNRDALLEASVFETTALPADGDAPTRTSLAEYVSRMPEGQEKIYYATGESRRQIEASPHLEAFRAKGFEVLMLTDQVDELWVTGVPEFDGREFASISMGEADLGDDGIPEKEDGFASLTSWLGTVLEDRVKQVRLTSRLTTSPACLVGDSFDMPPALERMYRASGQELPRSKRILELNPEHELVAGLLAKVQAEGLGSATEAVSGEDTSSEDTSGENASGEDGVAASDLQGEEAPQAAEAPRTPEVPETAEAPEALVDAAELLYGSAVLAEGGELDEPAAFAARLARQLARGL